MNYWHIRGQIYVSWVKPYLSSVRLSRVYWSSRESTKLSVFKCLLIFLTVVPEALLVYTFKVSPDIIIVMPRVKSLWKYVHWVVKTAAETWKWRSGWYIVLKKMFHKFLNPSSISLSLWFIPKAYRYLDNVTYAASGLFSDAAPAHAYEAVGVYLLVTQTLGSFHCTGCCPLYTESP